MDKLGVSLYGIAVGAEKVGFRTMGVKIPFEMMEKEKPFPCVVNWGGVHFVVVYDIVKGKVKVADPAYGLIDYDRESFEKMWLADPINEFSKEGHVLLLEPTPEFHNDDLSDQEAKFGISYFFHYVKAQRRILYQLIVGLVISSILSLFIPLLTQSVVDIGINNQDISFVYLVLIGQLMVFLGRITTEVIRGWLFLHLSARMSISIISDFWMKLMALPISFFETRKLGDILQRIRDHDRIKNFLTGSAINTLFSMLNLIVYSVIILTYNVEIYLIYLFGSVFYVVWITLFLKKRKEIDYRRFNESANSQGNEVQLVQGIREIKLFNNERVKRWEWENIQIKLFRVNIKGLVISQLQDSGGSFINEVKNIFITFWAATQVIQGNLTLGMMLAITQIIGQLNAPILSLVNFIRQAQDAKISLERLGEIHSRHPEDHDLKSPVIPEKNDSIKIENVSFKYDEYNREDVLNGVDFILPSGKTTAIVGESGSGKSSLLKLLCKFYEPSEGEILVGDTPLNQISSYEWRERIGVVMQDGFMFSDSIASNINMGDPLYDNQKLTHASKAANIYDFINELPQKFQTKIGYDGHGLSEGQKQRILIARAIYKDPDYFFFDEATSSLDSKNEREIIDNIQTMLKGKTVMIISHRLSTITNADQIVVLDKHQIKEIGTHNQLVKKKGIYYELINKQLINEKIH